MTRNVTSYKRLLLQGMLAFLLGRVWIFTINPFVIAYFALTMVERKGRNVVLMASILGMASVQMGTSLAKNTLIMLTLCFLDFLIQKSRERGWSTVLIGVSSSGVTLALGITNACLSVDIRQQIFVALLESIALLALINIFQWGVRFFLYENVDKILEQEELISVISLITLSLYGLPDPFGGLLSIPATIMYLLVLYVAYRYGASAGAIAGAAGGILAAMTGRGLVAIGLYSLLGIGVGMFRQVGKIMCTVFFVVTGFVLGVVFSQEIIGVVELRGIGSAAIIFACLPKRFIKMLQPEFSNDEDAPFAKEDVRTIANYRMEDFSGAFRRLSQSFSKFEHIPRKISEEDKNKLFEELSSKLCTDCTHCEECWGQKYSSTYESVRGMVEVACAQGEVEEENIQPDFLLQCVKAEDYIRQTNENVSATRMRISWSNKMAESRQAISEQMFAISELLRDFTKELGNVKEVDREEKKKALFALRGLGLTVKRFSMRTRKSGKVEIRFQAKSRRNGCILSKEICATLYDVFGIRFRIGRETKSVVSKEYETMCYEEDVNFKALTGMARVAKSGERVSGDNFSFLELSTGELLMILSDGMGSGMDARRDSGYLVDVLEDLMAAGFPKEAAIKLLNSMFVMSYEGKSFSTLDLASIDLYTGELELLKNGTAATFIRHNQKVKTVLSSALPVGIEMGAEAGKHHFTLTDGDLVIMVTDGIVDAFPGKEKEFYLENILENIQSNNPSDIANTVLMRALEFCCNEPADDMSVLVSGIWKKSGRY